MDLIAPAIMTLRQLIGLAGALLLLVGVFIPFVSVPFAGGVPLVRPGASVNGALVLAMCLVGSTCILARVALGGFVAGALAVTVVGMSAAAFFRIVAAAQEGLTTELRGNPFAPMGEMMLNAVRLDAGFAVLLVGALLLMGASALTLEAPDAAHRATGARVRLLEEWRAPVTPAWLAASVALIALGPISGTAFGDRIAPLMFARGTSESSGGGVDPKLEADLARASAPVADPEQVRYRRSVRLAQLSVGRTVLDEPGVFGEIYNDGNRSLDQVEITIYFLDANGRTVFEKSYAPVLASEYGFDHDGPLRPGYGRKFGVRADHVPAAWDKRVRVAVTDVKFAK